MSKTYMYKIELVECWHCGEQFLVAEEINVAKKQILTCTHCGKDCVAKFDLYRREKKIVMRHTQVEKVLGVKYDIPKILPTQKP